MADLNIPNLNKKSDKYLFKNKLPLKRKSKTKLLTESFLMLALSFLLAFINYLIPKKMILLKNLFFNIEKSYLIFIDLFGYFWQILLLIFVFISTIISFILLIGSFSRLIKVFRRKSKQMKYK